MRILILVNVGATLYKFRRELIDALLERGDSVYISSAQSPRLDNFTRLGCQIIETPLDRHGVNPLRDINLVLFYKRTIKNLKPDVVLSFTQKPNIYGGYICGRLGIPFLPTITGLGTGVFYSGRLIRRIVFALYRLGLKRVPQVFIQNEGCRELLQKERVIRDNFRLIPGSGVNLNRFRFEEYRDETSTIRLLYIGRMLFDKGMNEFFYCVEKMKNKYPQVIFEFLGPHNDDFKEIIDRLLAEDKLILYSETDDVRPYLKKCSVLVHPSYHEGMANVLLEAAATGRPVLASRIPGCQETFEEGVTGLGFEPRNSDDLCRAVEEFIGLSYERRKEMGLEGRLKMERDLDRKRVVQEYLDELGKL